MEGVRLRILVVLWAAGALFGAHVASAAAADPTIAAAGDIACSTADPGYNTGAGTTGPAARCHQADTGSLIQTLAPTAVAALGDNQYESGSLDEYNGSFDKWWGSPFKPLIHPVPGNHEYLTPSAQGYFDYFGSAAGDRSTGYYSYDLGSWHLIALNSNCDQIDCAAETQWLGADLAAHPAACTLAYWHHPLFTSGPTAGQPDNLASKQFWQVLYAHGADVILNGHDHDYERFGPQDPNGTADPGRGIREFVAGTGGEDLYTAVAKAANSEQFYTSPTFGVLLLTLHAGGYGWSFDPASGSFAESGSDVCYDQPPTAAGSFGPAQPVAGAAVAFDASGSSDPDSRIVSYAWDFGDGGGATGAQATHVFAAPGTYSVKLTVTDDGARSAQTSLTVPVAAPPAPRVSSSTPSPTLTLRVPRQSLRKALAHGLTVALSASAAGRLTLSASGRRSARRSSLGIGSARRAMPRGSHTLRLRLDAGRVRRLMVHGRLHVGLVGRLVTSEGGTVSASRHAALRR